MILSGLLATKRVRQRSSRARLCDARGTRSWYFFQWQSWRAWGWLKAPIADVIARLPRHHAGGSLVSATRSYCDEEHAKGVESFFAPKIEAIEGGPRTLASTLEDIRLCAARRKAQEPSAREFFAKRR